MGKILKLIGKSAITTLTSVLLIADGIMLRDVIWMAVDRHVDKKAAKKAKKEQETKAENAA